MINFTHGHSLLIHSSIKIAFVFLERINMNINFIKRKTKSEVIEMEKDNSNKNNKDDKLSNKKKAESNPLETDNDMDKPTRGIPRI